MLQRRNSADLTKTHSLLAIKIQPCTCSTTHEDKSSCYNSLEATISQVWYHNTQLCWIRIWSFIHCELSWCQSEGCIFGSGTNTWIQGDVSFVYKIMWLTRITAQDSSIPLPQKSHIGKLTIHLLSSSAMIISAASGESIETRSGLRVDSWTVKSWSPSKAWSWGMSMLTQSDDPFTDMVSKVKVNGSGSMKSGSPASASE